MQRLTDSEALALEPLHLRPRTRHVVLDTEATTFIVKFARVFDLAALAFDPESGRVLDRFQRKFNPNQKVPKAVRELTGVTNEELALCPRIARHDAKDLQQFLTGAANCCKKSR